MAGSALGNPLYRLFLANGDVQKQLQDLPPILADFGGELLSVLRDIRSAVSNTTPDAPEEENKYEAFDYQDAPILYVREQIRIRSVVVYGDTAGTYVLQIGS